MTDQRRRSDRRADALDSVIDLLTKARQRMAYVDQRIDDMAAGWPTGGEGGTETVDGEAFDYRSSTEANALNPKRDVVGPDKRRRKAIIDKLTELSNELDDIDRKYLGGGDGTKPPDPPGCAVLGRFKDKDGKRLWAPADRQTDGTAFLTNAEAEFNKGQSIGVCAWAYDFGRRAGRWPHRAEVDKHLAGQAVRVAPAEHAPAGVRLKRGWRKAAA